MALIPGCVSDEHPITLRHIEIRKEVDEGNAEIYYAASIHYRDPNEALMELQDWMLEETCSATKEECRRKLVKLIASGGDYAELRGLRVDEVWCEYDYKQELADAKKDLARRQREYPALYAAKGLA